MSELQPLKARPTPRGPGRGRHGFGYRLRLLGLLATALIASSSGARSPDQETTNARIEQAIESYTRAMASGSRDERVALFQEAERLFGSAIEAGARNAEIETNRGNAALQAERLGAAILAYRRALLLEPSHVRARQNLAHARSLLPNWVPTPSEGGLADTFFAWQHAVPSSQLETLAATSFAIAAALLALSIVRNATGFRLAASFAFALWAGLLAPVVLDPGRDGRSDGVVIVPEVTARAADSLNAPRRFSEPLPEGTELRIIEDRGGWLHVELYNGRSAWLTSSAVRRVSPEDPPRDAQQ